MAKNKQKPNWDKRNFVAAIVAVAVTVIGIAVSYFTAQGQGTNENVTQRVTGGFALVAHDIQGGVGNVTQNVKQTVNNVTQNITSSVSGSSSTQTPSIVLSDGSGVRKPDLNGSERRERLYLESIAPHSASVVDDGPYRHKATASTDSASEIIGGFPAAQDRDDYTLGLQHIAHVRKRLGGFTIYQVVSEGRTVRQRLDVARKAENLRLQRIADEMRVEEAARLRQAQTAADAQRAAQEVQRRQAENQANQQRAEFLSHYMPGEPDCLLLDRGSLTTTRDQSGVPYATGFVQNNCGKELSAVSVSINFYDSGGVLKNSASDVAQNLQPGDRWQWKVAQLDSSASDWRVEKITGY